MILKDIEPKNVFKFFEEISNIPRGSGNERAISDYLVAFCRERNLEVIQDEYLNVVIRKDAFKGYENSKRVILQGHMDMVCEKNSNTEHNFLKDPLELRIVDNMIYANGTTLGADNGIFIAYALAILDSNTISHPPLEVFITSEEEIGMGGAIGFNPQNIKGDYLINIDSEEEGMLLTSCAGGARSEISLKCQKASLNNTYKPFSLLVSGLKGGHSGMDIIKQRGNSNKIIGRVLFSLLTNNIDFHLGNINGGSKMNAIPRESSCTIFINNSDISLSKSIIGNTFTEIRNELESVDENLSISLKETNSPLNAFNKETTLKIINALMLIPNGVETMSTSIKDLPESSTNLGVITSNENVVSFESAVRSSTKSLKVDILNKHTVIANILGGEIKIDGHYPEWQYEKTSPLRDVFIESFKSMFNKEPHITAVHAGLECGIIKEKLPHLDIISFGPNHYDVHSPNEHVDIDSVRRMYEYLLLVLKNLK